jgi:predicted deacylase
MPIPLIVAAKKIEESEKVTGTLNAGFYFPNQPRDYIRRIAQIPYTIIRGENPGPTLCLTAGMDPTEYAAIAAAIKIARDLKPEDIRGTLFVVHISNILGFWERKYISSLDYKHLTGAFPGNPTGTISEVIAHHIFQNFISKSDYYVDLHGCDTHESMTGRSAFYKVGNEEVDKKSEGMAKSLGHDWVVPHDAKGADKSGPGPSFKIAALHGIPSALSELGEGDLLLEKELNGQYNAIMNLLKYLGMLAGNPTRNERQKVVDVTMVTVNRSGLFYSKVQPGDILERDDVLGEVKDVFGEVVEIVRAPEKGVVLTMIHNPVVEAGEIIILDYGLLR